MRQKKIHSCLVYKGVNMFGYENEIVQNDLDEIIDKKEIPFDMLSDKSVLITGASGMLATYMVYTLMRLNEVKGYNVNVIALVRNKEKAEKRFCDFLDDKNFEILVQDVCEEITTTKTVDYIVHAAGNASPKFIVNDPVGIIKANTLGTMNILELAKKKSVKNVLYTSTREVYGKVDYVEEIYENTMGVLEPTELRACYPESKRMSETILESYRVQYGVPYCTVRIAHSYGPGMAIDEDGRVMSDFISDVVNNRDIVLKSEGTAKRAFCYITDAVSAMFLVLLKGENGSVYNVANEKEEKEIREVASILVKLKEKSNLKVVFDIPEEQSVGYSKMGRVKLNTVKLEQLGWIADVSLVEGLERTVKSFR